MTYVFCALTNLLGLPTYYTYYLTLFIPKLKKKSLRSRIKMDKNDLFLCIFILKSQH